MLNKRGLVRSSIFAVIVLVVLSLTFVIAQDPDLAPFDASVQLQNSPPTIVAIYAVDDQGSTAGDDVVNALNGDAADPVNNAEIEFLVQDLNGIDNLPGDPSIPFRQSTAVGQLGTAACTGGNCNIEVYVTNPGTAYAATNKLFDAGSCIRLPTCPNSQAGAGCAVNQMEYRCTVPMNYYDEPSGSSVDLNTHWDIFVGIADGSGTDTGTSSGLSQEQTTFEYTSNAYFIISSPVAGIQFTSISLTGTDQQSNNDPLALNNRGNVDFTLGTIQGSDLTSDDVGGTGNNMPVDAFSISVQNGGTPLAECDATVAPVTADVLNIATQFIDAGGTPNLLYGKGSPPVTNEELYFCL